ncbi:MAG TPA: ferritin-like domain-containing protein [Thermoleophilia bacterium]|nr:ferritin-like domain-containing protein [Thermoleophilia bacterium]
MPYDTSLIRPELRAEQVKARGQGFRSDRKAKIKKSLHTLHALEIMAVNIYKCQITRAPCELNHQLTIAMCNEMTHMQDFQTRLFEYGLAPSKTRWTFWMVGYVFGLGSRMLGPRRILKTGIWAEKKAVDHYGEFLEQVEWDDETREVLEKDRADEYGHLARWEHLLSDPGAICG